MNNLIKTFVAILLLCVTTITFAQQQTPVRSFTSVKFLAENLDLTDQQTKRVEAFLDEQDKQLKALRNGDTERDELLPAVNEIRAKTIKAIKSVLNEEQLETFNKLINQRKRKGDLRNGRDGFMGVENLNKKLNLTEKQIPAFNSIMKGQAQQIKAIREDMQSNENRAESRSKIFEIRNATQEKIKKILNEEQLGLYNEVLSKRVNRFKLNREKKSNPTE